MLASRRTVTRGTRRREAARRRQRLVTTAVGLSIGLIMAVVAVLMSGVHHRADAIPDSRRVVTRQTQQLVPAPRVVSRDSVRHGTTARRNTLKLQRAEHLSDRADRRIGHEGEQ